MKKTISALLTILSVISIMLNMASFAFAAELFGEVNGDGKVSVVDAKWILQMVAGIRDVETEEGGSEKLLGDINSDGKVSVVDAKWVLQVVAGIREPEGIPSEKPDVPDAPSVDFNAEALANEINKATAAAVNAKAGHDWERHCQVEEIDCGPLKIKEALNNVIKTFSEDDDVDSVVKSFLGDGDKKETIKKGTSLTDIKDSNGNDYYHGTSYALMATQLKAEDIKNLRVNGDTYTFELPDCTNPDRNGNTALSRLTNDFVVHEEIESEIGNYISNSVLNFPEFNINYSKIKCSVTIKDGKLIKLSYSFYAEADFDIKFTVLKTTGNCSYSAEAAYSNFIY